MRKYLIAFCGVCLSMGMLAANVGIAHTDQTENIKSYWAENNTVMLLCEYDSKWISPTKEMPKGQIVSMGRIIDVLKGNQALIGNKVVYQRFVEDPPLWLKSGKLPGIPQVRYFFTNAANLTPYEDYYGGKMDSLPGFGFNDQTFGPLFREMLENNFYEDMTSNSGKVGSRLQTSGIWEKYDTVLLLCEYAKGWGSQLGTNDGPSPVVTYSIIVRVIKGDANVEDLLCYQSSEQLPSWLPLSGMVPVEGKLRILCTNSTNIVQLGSKMEIRDQSSCRFIPYEVEFSSDDN